jgi:hypothetical protein
MKDWKERIEIICRARKGSMDDGQFRATVEYNLEQIISERGKEIIKMLENTDVQMSVNGDVSQDEIAMARFIYKAHIKHIIKKIGSAIIPPNPINGNLPSETDSATK